MIITGDPSQVDLPNGQTSGLAEALRHSQARTAK
jgi:phosphate starvation-inducible PhoH-like protein